MWLPLVSKAVAKSHVFSQSNILVHTQYQLVAYYGQPTMSLGSGMKCGALSSNLLLQHTGAHSAGLIHVFLTTSGNALVIMGMLGERMDQQKSRALRNSPPAMTKLFIAHLQGHTVCIGPGVFHTCVHTHMRAHTHAHKKCSFHRVHSVSCVSRDICKCNPFHST